MSDSVKEGSCRHERKHALNSLLTDDNPEIARVLLDPVLSL